jgi:hypothetical protein
MIVDPKRRKREANRAHYEKTRDRHDAVLLRLDPGDLAVLDAARAPLGLSRSAFVKLHLLAAAEVLSAKSLDIEAAMRQRGVSLSTFLQAAVAAELARPPAEPDSGRDCASEFDALFGQPRAEA